MEKWPGEYAIQMIGRNATYALLEHIGKLPVDDAYVNAAVKHLSRTEGQRLGKIIVEDFVQNLEGVEEKGRVRKVLQAWPKE